MGLTYVCHSHTHFYFSKISVPNNDERGKHVGRKAKSLFEVPG
jgi:hypothetical protein